MRASSGRVVVVVLGLLAGVLVVLPPAVPPAAWAAPVSPEVVSFTPFRAFDTRAGAKVPAGGTATVVVAGRSGIPANAPAVAVGVTAVSASAAGSMTVFPCGSPRPAAPTLHFAANQAVAGAVVAKVGTGGGVCVHTTAASHLIVDVSDYWRAGAAFTGVVPVRALDAALAAGAVRTVPLAGRAGIVAGAKAAAVNVTVVGPGSAGTVTVWPCGTRPTATAVSYAAGRTVAAGVLSGLDGAANLCVSASTAVRVQVDVTAFAPAGSVYQAVRPVRAASGVTIPAGGIVPVVLAGRFGLPSGAGAAAVSITTVAPAAGGDLTVFPCGVPKPGTSTLNHAAGQAVTGHALSRIGTGGAVCIGSKAATRVTVDLYGYYKGADLGAGATAVEGKGRTMCALMPGGYVKCWGDNAQGQLGDGTTELRMTPVQVKGIVGATAVAGNCAIVGGQVRCWGTGAPTGPLPGITGATAIDGNCVLATGGRAWCWGYGYGYEVNQLDWVTGATAIAGSGTGNACALVGGRVLCDGSDIGVAGATALDRGPLSSCALLGNGQVTCWTDQTAPTLVGGVSGAASISVAEMFEYREYPAGSFMWQFFKHVCVRLATGAVKCWGDNYYGQVGVALRDDNVAVAEVPGLAGVIAVATSGMQSCAIVAGGSVRCWGTTHEGPYGDATFGSGPAGVSGITGATAVAISEGHTCAAVAGGVKCWGTNEYGELGLPGWQDRWLPTVPAAGSGAAASLSVALVRRGNDNNGFATTCAVAPGGALSCWGSDTGKGLTGVVSSTVAGGRRELVDAWGDDYQVPYHHICAATATGARCWGDNAYGQLGDGTTIERSAPTAVVGLAGGVRQVAAAYNRTCAVLGDGTVRCWGEGYGTRPVAVAGLSSVTAIAVAKDHQCAVKADGTVWCWGGNGSGQLGDGTTTDRTAPVKVAGLGSLTMRTVAVAEQHSCATSSTGLVRCWGGNGSGQLGDGTTTGRPLPVAVIGITGATAVAAGGNSSTCAIVSGGALKCWGGNRVALGILAPMVVQL